MPTYEDYGDIWVCTDCHAADANGAREHEGRWYVDGSDTPCDREPFGLWVQGHDLSDNTCSNHAVEDTYDEDGYRDGGTTACPHCGQDGHENGIQEFSHNRCNGCGSNLGGSRYRYHVTMRLG